MMDRNMQARFCLRVILDIWDAKILDTTRLLQASASKVISNSAYSFLGPQNFLVFITKTNFEEADGLGINEKKFARHIVHLTNEVVFFYALT